ncbi:hypothetical protein [Aeromonas salmonicida]|uniref:hypothetical protein n=1 Tax=Aeromonas salmonicida TaxID=645 RepID=UPI0038D46E03
MARSIRQKVIDGVAVVKGTAGEAYETHEYQKMVEKYGAETALAILEPELKKAGETKETFSTYLRVKQKVQTGVISPQKAKKEAEDSTANVLNQEGILPV